MDAQELAKKLVSVTTILLKLAETKEFKKLINNAKFVKFLESLITVYQKHLELSQIEGKDAYDKDLIETSLKAYSSEVFKYIDELSEDFNKISRRHPILMAKLSVNIEALAEVF